MTPASWRTPSRPTQPAPKPGLKLVREIPLPGPANRFDYQSVDPATGRIYINHMNAGRTLVFDADSGKVLTEIMDLPRATGVWAVPMHHQVYVSAAGAHEVAIIDDRTLKVTSRVGDIRFPDGIAFAPEVDKVFVSDESGGTDVVIDPKTGKKRSTIELGGEAGNTQYDSVSHCILVAVQTKNELVAIDPVSERIVQAWDAAWLRLYVAAESGVLSAYWLDGSSLRPIGEVRAPHAHTVSVDPRTHLVYLPLESVDGHPVLRIFEPTR